MGLPWRMLCVPEEGDASWAHLMARVGLWACSALWPHLVVQCWKWIMEVSPAIITEGLVLFISSSITWTICSVSPYAPWGSVGNGAATAAGPCQGCCCWVWLSLRHSVALLNCFLSLLSVTCGLWSFCSVKYQQVIWQIFL